MGFHLKIVYSVVWLISVINLSHSLFLHVEFNSQLLDPGFTRSTAVYDGLDTIFILGGATSGGAAGVFKYSITTDIVEKIGTMGDIREGSGVWTGHNEIHYFGYDWTAHHNGVWKMDPTNMANRIRVASISSSRLLVHNTAFWDGKEFIYSFGGYRTQNVTYKYSMVSKTLTEYQSVLPGRDVTSSVWDDVQNKAYIFGGRIISSSNNDYSDEILEFDPVANTATKLNSSLSSETDGSCAVWTGTRAYILGGQGQTARITSSRFTPSTGVIEPIQLDISSAMYGHACVWIAKLNRIYIFGGSSSLYENRISYIDLPEEEIPTTTQPTTPPHEGPALCKDADNGVLLSNPECCTSYFLCFNQLPLVQNCPSPLQFHPVLKMCEEKSIVNCGNYYYNNHLSFY